MLIVTAIIPLFILAIWVSGCFPACGSPLQYQFERCHSFTVFSGGAPVNQCLALLGHQISCEVTDEALCSSMQPERNRNAVTEMIITTSISDMDATVFNTVCSQLSGVVFAT